MAFIYCFGHSTCCPPTCGFAVSPGCAHSSSAAWWLKTEWIWSGDSTSNAWSAQCPGPRGNVARISLTPADGQALPWAGPGEIGRLECEEHELLALEEKSGQVLLALPRGWTELFPHLATGFPPAVIAALLATTRLVGMICPGLHSIYSGLDLSCDDAAVPAETLVYRVFRADPRVRLVEMAVQTGGLRGTVHAFLRPKPSRANKPGGTCAACSKR